MHYSAKCIETCMSSLRLSVTLVDQDHISWKSWKLIAPTISPTSSLFVAQRPSTYSQGNMGKFWGDYRGGWEKVVCGNISETRKDRGKVTTEGYRNSPTLFRTVPSPTPYAGPDLWGGAGAPGLPPTGGLSPNPSISLFFDWPTTRRCF